MSVIWSQNIALKMHKLHQNYSNFLQTGYINVFNKNTAFEGADEAAASDHSINHSEVTLFNIIPYLVKNSNYYNVQIFC